MRIINKSQDLFDRKFETFYNRDDFYSCVKEHKSMTFSIYTGLEPDNNTKFLQANVRWCYSAGNEVIKEFEYSPAGFEQACTWIDKARIEFIKQLL